MSKNKFIITTIFFGVLLTTITAQATVSTQQLSHTSTKVNTGWSVDNDSYSNVNDLNRQMDKLEAYYILAKIYLEHFDLLYYIIKCNIEKKNNILPCNLYKFLNSEFGYTKESLEKKFKFSGYLPKYYDENCELDENSIIEDSASRIEKIINGYKNEIKKFDSFKKEFQEYGTVENNLLYRKVEDFKCGIEKNIENINLKIKNIKKFIPNEKNDIEINEKNDIEIKEKNDIDIKEKNNIEDLNISDDIDNDNDDLDIAVTETIFKLMEFKILIKNYYRTIKNYSDHFDVLNNIFIKLNQENKNNILPLNLYKFLTEKCDVKKENIEKKFEFCPALLKYYDENCELDKDLIEKSFLEIKDIIEIYNEKVLELPNFSFELAKNNIDKNNCFIDEIKGMMGETEKNIKNINLKIKSIKKFLNK